MTASVPPHHHCWVTARSGEQVLHEGHDRLGPALQPTKDGVHLGRRIRRLSDQEEQQQRDHNNDYQLLGVHPYLLRPLAVPTGERPLWAAVIP